MIETKVKNKRTIKMDLAGCREVLQDLVGYDLESFIRTLEATTEENLDIDGADVIIELEGDLIKITIE